MNEWRKRAICTADQIDIFFPTIEKKADDAKAICNQCPVMLQCREYALENRLDEGVWGGLSAPERRSILRKRRRAA